jgi:hypothetical protein
METVQADQHKENAEVNGRFITSAMKIKKDYRKKNTSNGQR